MQAKTRSAPRTPSPCRRSIQSPTRFGSSRRTSAQSPTGASSGRGRQTRWTLVARAADSRARRRRAALGCDRPRAVIVQPPRIMPESRASQPSVVLWAKTTEPTPSSSKHATPFAKGICHRSSKKCTVLWLPVVHLRRRPGSPPAPSASADSSDRMDRRKMARQATCALAKRRRSPRGRRRDRVVVRRVGEPDRC